MKEGIVTGVSVLRQFDGGLKEISITIDDFDSYILYDSGNDYLEYINECVQFDVRQDVVNGIVRDVICSVALKRKINVIDDKLKDDYAFDILEGSSKSLIPDKSNTTSIITFDSLALRKDDYAMSEVVLVNDIRHGSSSKAAWFDFLCLDKNSKLFNLRHFYPRMNDEEEMRDLASQYKGHYMFVNIKNTPYGLQTDGSIKFYDEEVQIPPEVELCKQRLKLRVERDDELSEYVRKYDMINFLSEIIYIEPGYHLVEMEVECAIISTICKIFGNYDSKLLYRLVFVSRGYLLASAAGLSSQITNYHRVITSALKNDYKLLHAIDLGMGIDKEQIDKALYVQIHKMVKDLMNERSGIVEENSLNHIISSLNSSSGFLFNAEFKALD